MALNPRMNSRGMRELLGSVGVRRELERRAAEVEAAAKAAAPVDTGRLRNSIHVEMEKGAVGNRWEARVVADTPYAAVIAARNAFLAGSLDAAR